MSQNPVPHQPDAPTAGGTGSAPAPTTDGTASAPAPTTDGTASAPAPAAAEAVSEIEGRHQTVGDLHVLKHCTLTVPSGEVCVLGERSRPGKPTLRRSINQLEDPTAGTVRIDGVLQGYAPEPLADGRWQRLGAKQIAAQRARIGMVFPRFHLFPHLTALA